MSTDAGPPHETSPPPLCIACNNPGTKRCADCDNAGYCSANCQAQDLEQHKAICQSFATLTPRPSSQHFRAILFPVDEDSPRFKWILDSTAGRSLNEDLQTEGSLGFSQVGEHYRLNRSFAGNKKIIFAYRQTFLGDNSPVNSCIFQLKGIERGHMWRGPFIAYGCTELNDGIDLVATDLDTNDLGAMVAFFNGYSRQTLF